MNLLSQISLKELPNKTEYPFSLPLIQQLDELRFDAPITFFVGENGAGKSTILEAIAWAVGVPTIGEQDIETDTTLKNAQKLGECFRLGWKQKTNRGFFSRAEDFFGYSKRMNANILELESEEKEIETRLSGNGDLAKAQGVINAQKMAFENRYGRSLTDISHGESFMKFFSSRLNQQGIYIIDEPEASLSPKSQLLFMGLVQNAVKNKKSQFIIATHSPLLMAMQNAKILVFENDKIINKKLEETAHFQLNKSFFENPDLFLSTHIF